MEGEEVLEGDAETVDEADGVKVGMEETVGNLFTILRFSAGSTQPQTGAKRGHMGFHMPHQRRCQSTQRPSCFCCGYRGRWAWFGSIARLASPTQILNQRDL
jgi:hypothetical protein